MPTATSATAACTSGSTSRCRPRRAPGVPPSSSSPRPQLVATHGGSLSGEHGDGRARSELLPAMYSPAAIELFSRGQGHRSTPATCSTRASLVGPAPLDADLRMPAAARAVPLRRRLGFAYHDDGGDFRRPCTAASGSASAGPTPPPPVASCARRTWPPGTRRTPPAAGRGCCRRWSTAPWCAAAGAPRRCTRRWTCACAARAARRSARPASTWPRTRPRCCTSPTGTASVPAATTRWAGCPGGPGWPRAPRVWRTRRCAPRRWGRW